MMPGSAFAGLALCAAMSALHCRAASFQHDAGRPRTLGLPGWHVKLLLPSRRTILLPCTSAPTIRAESVTCRGPAAIARAIWTSAGSPAAPPRTDRTSWAQQQTGQKDDHQAIPSDEFHK